MKAGWVTSMAAEDGASEQDPTVEEVRFGVAQGVRVGPSADLQRSPKRVAAAQEVPGVELPLNEEPVKFRVACTELNVVPPDLVARDVDVDFLDSRRRNRIPAALLRASSNPSALTLKTEARNIAMFMYWPSEIRNSRRRTFSLVVVLPTNSSRPRRNRSPSKTSILNIDDLLLSLPAFHTSLV